MNHEEVKNILLQNPEFRKAYENPPLRLTFARAIVERRHKVGISQVELARRMGSTQVRISTIERGLHQPNDKTLERLGEALGCTFVVSVEAKEG